MDVFSYIYYNRTTALPLYAIPSTGSETVCQRRHQNDVHTVHGSLGSKENLQNVFLSPYIHSFFTSWYPPLISIWLVLPESLRLANQPPL